MAGSWLSPIFKGFKANSVSGSLFQTMQARRNAQSVVQITDVRSLAAPTDTRLDQVKLLFGHFFYARHVDFVTKSRAQSV
jgi:hypothetical protein